MPLIQDYNKLFEHTDNIKKIILNGNVVWPTEKPTGPDYTEPFYSENTTDYTESVTFYRYSSSAPTFDIYYSLDKGNTWNFCGSTAESFTYRNTAHTKVWFCAETTRWGSTSTIQPGISIRNCKKVGGNSMSLLYGRDFNGTETTFPGNSYIFAYLFNGNTDLVDASELLLPSTVLVSSCYRDMFGGGTFGASACVSLVKGPTLPDATRASSDTRLMFDGCTSLNEIKCFFTTSEPVFCDSWAIGVSSTGTFYKKAGVTWSAGANGIPSGWTVVEV